MCRVDVNEKLHYYNRKKHTLYLKESGFCKVYLKKYNFFEKTLANAMYIRYTVKAVT